MFKEIMIKLNYEFKCKALIKIYKVKISTWKIQKIALNICPYQFTIHNAPFPFYNSFFFNNSTAWLAALAAKAI